MALLTVMTFDGTSNSVHVDDDYQLPELRSGEWVEFVGINRESLCFFSNNILGVRFSRASSA